MRKVLLFLLFVSLFAFSGCTENDSDIVKPTISLEEDTIELYVGDSKEINPVVTNLSATALFDYSFDKEDIISITNGTVKALKEGEVKLTISLKEFSDVKVELIVKVFLKPSFKVSGEGSVTVGKEIVLNVEKVSIDEEVEWTSSNETIATCEKGVVKGISEGTVIITAKAEEYEDQMEIIVTPAPNLKISGDKIVLIGKTIILTCELEDLDGTVNWATSDETIATINETGVVTGVSVGLVSLIASVGEIKEYFEIEVKDIPVLKITGETEVMIGDFITLECEVKNSEELVTWKSSENSIAMVNKGLVKGVKEGKVTITASIGEYSDSFEVNVIKKEDLIVYDYTGGSSNLLYMANGTASGSIVVNNYNNSDGSYWGNNGYSSYIYLTDSAKDPKATFSDRIYIGKNEETGLYEIVSILLSGPSSWPANAEYVIAMSSSYSNYRSIHPTVQKLSVGMVVCFDKEIATIKAANPSTVTFYSSVPTNSVLTLKKENVTVLDIPSRLGYKFLGWFDTNDVEYKDISNATGKLRLYAKWEILTPVTEIKVDNMVSEMVTEDAVKLNVSVIPTDAYFTDVYYYTSNKDIVEVSNDGTLTAHSPGTVTITITDFIKNITNKYEITVYSVDSIDLYFENDFNGTLKVDETAKAHAFAVGKNGQEAKLTYTSSNPEIATIDKEGNIVAKSIGEASMTIKNGDDSSTALTFGVVVTGFNTSKTIDKLLELIAENNFGVVERGNSCIYNDGTQRYYQTAYGSVNKYLFAALNVNRTYESVAEANSSGHKSRGAADTIEFVTVHDTATLTGTCEGIASNMANGSTSIHYAVGNYGIYSCVPEKYIAYHAGDGTGTSFRWIATGVKTTDNSAPVFGITGSGSSYYFTVNGINTTINAPISNGSKTISNPSSSNLTNLGPVWKIVNGEYYMGNTWACFSQVAAGVIGSFGGNNNSIGIEMCVNVSGDIYDTWQRTSLLVADILVRNNLDLTRVKQHNTWTGKNCPQSIIAGDYWDSFMEMVTIAYEIRKNYQDVEITMKSNNPNIINDTGHVINAPLVTTTVSYTVTCKIGGESKSLTLYSVVPGTTTWLKWSGSYPSSLIWNNGKLVLENK